MKLSQVKLYNSVNKTVREICGEKIGEGFNRDVYLLKDNSRYVVKVERHPERGGFSNACEWRNFVNYREWTLMNKWIAPCALISETGQVMLQRRVVHKDISFYPKLVPAFFTDLKIENFGWMDGRLVCCDYPFLIITPGTKSMKTAKWWSVKD